MLIKTFKVNHLNINSSIPSPTYENNLNTNEKIYICMLWNIHQFSSVQSLSRVRLFATPWITARQASLSITTSRSLLRFTSIESVMPSSQLILCCSLLLLTPIPPSIKVFSNESTLHMRWLKYWSFSFTIIPSKEIPGLISLRMDWLDLLAVQGTLKSSPTPPFKSINFLALSLLHSSTLICKCMFLHMKTYVKHVFIWKI